MQWLKCILYPESNFDDFHKFCFTGPQLVGAHQIQGAFTDYFTGNLISYIHYKNIYGYNLQEKKVAFMRLLHKSQKKTRRCWNQAMGVCRGVTRFDSARDKFGAPMFKPEVFREQMYCLRSTCDFVETFRRPGNCALLLPPLVTPLRVWHSASEAFGHACTLFNNSNEHIEHDTSSVPVSPIHQRHTEHDLTSPKKSWNRSPTRYRRCFWKKTTASPRVTLFPKNSTPEFSLKACYQVTWFSQEALGFCRLNVSFQPSTTADVVRKAWPISGRGSSAAGSCQRGEIFPACLLVPRARTGFLASLALGTTWHCTRWRAIREFFGFAGSGKSSS